MDLRRFWRHVLMSPVKAARCFPSSTLDAIQREVAAHEKLHSGEVAFVVEAELTTAQLWADDSSRDRAREIFALHGVWNTEQNNGVLIYVLLADHRVEIVADRSIDAKVGREGWQQIVRMVDDHFREHRFEEGAIGAVRAVSDLLARHFPASGEDRNELGDRPVLI